MKDSPPSSKNPRTITTRPPIYVIVSIVVICLLVLTGIFYATVYWNRTFEDARMTGVIIDKQFTEQPTEEVTLGTQGLRATNSPGVFTLTVRVRNRDGESNDYTVWVPEVMFNEVNVGDDFDVGPYLVPGATR